MKLSSVFGRITRFYSIVIAVSLMTGCPLFEDGGSSKSGSSGGNNTNPTENSENTDTTTTDVNEPTIQTGPVYKVEITQKALLFTLPGEQKQLEAKAYDAENNLVNTPIQWSSSSNGDISVDENGMATANSSNGSSQIIATADGIESPPLIAVVTRLADGVITLEDQQILSGPVETDSEATPSLDNTYCLQVADADAPVVGDRIVGTGEIPVAGEVVTVESINGISRICLKLVPVAQLFPDLEIYEVIDLTNAEVAIPDDIASFYDITREGNTWSFIPKDTGSNSESAASRTYFSDERLPSLINLLPNNQTYASSTTSVSAGPFDFNKGCTKDDGSSSGVQLGGAGGPLPFSMPSPPVISFTLNPSYDLAYSTSNGLERFLLLAQPTIIVDGKLEIGGSIEAKIDCVAELFVIKVPIGGALSFIVGGLIPISIGFEVSGKITVQGVTLGLKSETQGNIRLGATCEPNCTFVGDMPNFYNKQEPYLKSDHLLDTKIEPALLVYGKAGFDVGNQFFSSLVFKAFELKAGGKVSGNFASKDTQANDPLYKSEYKASLEGVAKVGNDVEHFIQLLSLGNLEKPELKLEKDLAKSPQGELAASKSSFNALDIVNIEVTLSDETLHFITTELYNVEEVVLFRKENGNLIEIGRQAAAEGQQIFNFNYTASSSGLASDFHAFVITRLLPLEFLSLELTNTAALDSDAFIRMDMGEIFACAIKQTGNYACTGANGNGNFGTGNTDSSEVYVSNPNLGNLRQIAAGTYSACAIQADNSLYCWGWNELGEVGIENPNPEEDRVLTPTNIGSAKSVDVGAAHACAITLDSGVMCWGYNGAGQVGIPINSDDPRVFTPTTVPGLNNVSKIDLGPVHSCALLIDGTAKCWGSNNVGELGDGTTKSTSTPVAVQGLTNATKIDISGTTACALDASKDVYCWGRIYFDRTSNPPPPAEFSSSPTKIIGMENSADIAVFNDGLCAVKTDGTVWCRGNNQFGALGNGTTTSSKTPVRVSGLTEVVAVSAGYNQLCARRRDGSLWCWGYNLHGQLGDGTTDMRTSPVQIFGHE